MDHSGKGFTIAAGSEVQGQFYGLLVLGDVPAVIDEIDFQGAYEGDSDIEGVELPVGAYVPMRFTRLLLTSGTVSCMKE